MHGKQYSGTFICEICQGPFINEIQLEKHKYSQHLEQYPIEEDTKVFVKKISHHTECSICKKPFATKGNFLLHFGRMHKDSEADAESSFRRG